MTTFALLFALLAPPEPAVLGLVKSKIADPSRPFVLVVSMTVKPGQEKTFTAAYRAAFAGTKAEPGYLAYELTRSAEEPSTYVLYEKWKSLDALASHMNEPHTTAFLKTFPSCTSSTELKVFVPVE